MDLVVDEEVLLDWNLSLGAGSILHPDYKVGGWFWKGIASSKLFKMNVPLKNFSEEEISHLLYSEKIYTNGASGDFIPSFEGVVTGIKRRRLQRDWQPIETIGDAISSDFKDSEGSQKSNRDKEASFFKFIECGVCGGSRLNERALSVKFCGANIAELNRMELSDLYRFLKSNVDSMTSVALTVVNRLLERLELLVEIGVGYLSLSRSVGSLSGGESQRVKMARQLGCDLVGMMYIMDEPTVGLHPRDMQKLLDLLRYLRDRGNSVLVVEHEPVIILGADYVFDLGPHAGAGGGQVIFNGTVPELLASINGTNKFLSPTALHLAPKPRIQVPIRREVKTFIQIKGGNLNNLKNMNVKIPLDCFLCVTGVAGAGKSSLIRGLFTKQCPTAVVIDQSPVGRSSRSNPATYTGAFDWIRKVFAAACQQSASIFSFNSEGACKECKGLGRKSVEMHFLESVRVLCSVCKGKRFLDSVLQYRFQDKNITQVLDMTIDEAFSFFSESKQITKRLEILRRVGLGYLKLGQSVSTLSGGEAQRLKLASELHKKGFVYILDEPSTGLHMADVQKLIDIIQALVDGGNTVIVIEHNLDIVTQADWIIDLGPEGGSQGGKVVSEGPPEEVALHPTSHTGKFLKELIDMAHYQSRPVQLLEEKRFLPDDSDFEDSDSSDLPETELDSEEESTSDNSMPSLNDDPSEDEQKPIKPPASRKPRVKPIASPRASTKRSSPRKKNVPTPVKNALKRKRRAVSKASPITETPRSARLRARKSAST
jgi:excinuclease UvrABC ATPase subunit